MRLSWLAPRIQLRLSNREQVLTYENEINRPNEKAIYSQIESQSRRRRWYLTLMTFSVLWWAGIKSDTPNPINKAAGVKQLWNCNARRESQR